MTFSDRCELLAGFATPQQVAAGAAPWLTEAFVLTDGARTRLRRWSAAGGPKADPGTVCFAAGPLEPELEALLVVRVLDRLPPPVQWHVTGNVVLVAVGHRTAGWIGTLPALPRPDERPHVIAIAAVPDEDEFAATLAHEVGHSWLRPVLPVHQAPPAPHEARAYDEHLAQLAAAWRVTDPRPETRALSEFRTARLAHEWGFRGHAADVDRFAADLRRARRKDIA